MDDRQRTYHERHQDERNLARWRALADDLQARLDRIRLVVANQEPRRDLDRTGFCPGGTI